MEFVLGGGQQPEEAMVSVICEMFNCTPPEARALDLAEVRKISDVRSLQSSFAQHNQDVSKMNPAGVPLWLESLEALND